MVKKVLKFGGTSVGTTERIRYVADLIKKEQSLGNQIIAVVSAMSGKTNELMKLSNEISDSFNKRELDVLLSSGEQVTCALLAGALIRLKIKARSFLNWQIPILTDGDHTNARIINMHVEEINKYLEEDGIAIIPGFQGISKNFDITTIGRGGSDATAVAVAKIFNAITGHDLSARDIALLHTCTKLSRGQISPTKRDHYVDRMAYAGIEYECVMAEEE